MKLLPKQLINTDKATERKKEIDEGLALARKVDTLRELKATEEQELLKWRESSLKTIQYEIDQFLEKRESLKEENMHAHEVNEALKKPLASEWSRLNSEKDSFQSEKELFRQNQILLAEDRKSIEIDKIKVSTLIAKATKNENDTEKAKIEAVSLKELAQREYEIAKSEHDIQTDTHEKKMSDLEMSINEYKIATITANRETQQAKDHEADLIIRENDLARRLKRLQGL